MHQLSLTRDAAAHAVIGMRPRLRIDDLAALTRSRPLLSAQIQQMRQAMLDIEECARSDRDEDVRLARDLDEQRLHLRQLSATGEVITAATLRDARARRDDAWMAVRHAYVDRDGSPSAGMVAAFEAAQSDADRQADLLRADAARAAEFAHCSGRIEQMRERRAQLAQAQIVLDARRSALEQVWKDALRNADLPELDAESLKEWQGRRSDALQAFDRLTEVRGELERIRNEGAEGFNAVVSALHLVGAPALGAPNEDVAARLAKATEHALEWERQASRGDAEREARAKVQREQRAELIRLDDSIAKSTRESEAHRAALQAWCGRLFLDRNAEPDAVRARLEELDAFARKADELAEARLRQRNHQLGIDDLDRQVRALCDLIDEPMPTLVEDFAERLRKRLAIARDSDRQRTTLTRELAQASGRRQRAATERVQHMATLEQLCRNAGVTAIDDLPACEEKAHRKRVLAGRLAVLRQQLADASSSSEQGLRERLAGQDAASMKFELERIGTDISRQDAELAAMRQAEELARHALEAIDTADTAAAARESMEAAAARLRSAIRPWARLRLAHALLREALNRFRERAQAPMIAAASIYFTLITGGAFVRLVADDSADKPVLRAERAGGAIIGVEAMSEGTADQLYLALRLAALELRRGSHPDMPLVLDDVLITSDDTRATNILKALERFASDSQVVIFTHHRHLIDVAGAALPASVCTVHML